MNKPTKRSQTTWTQEVDIAGSDLVDTVRKLVQEGNVRRLIIKNPEGDSLLEIPLTAGVAIGGALVVLTPVLAALGALAALLARVRLVIIREQSDEDEES